MFIAKFDSAGNHVWSGGFGFGDSYAITADISNNVLVAGQLHGPLYFGSGDPLVAFGTDLFFAKLPP